MTEDMWAEWKKFKEYDEHGNYVGPWDQDFGKDGLENWTGDWSKPAKAWDRLACLEGKKSKSDLEQEGKPTAEKTETKRKLDNGDREDTKATGKETKELDGHSKKPRVSLNNKNKSKNEKGSKDGTDLQDEEYEEGSDWFYQESKTIPQRPKDQVEEIVQFLGKAHLLKIPKTPDKLTEKIKTRLREETPSSEDCRLNVYWKRPAVGVHMKAEKRDIMTYALDPDLGSYGLRLAAVLKAGSMLVP